MRIRLPLAVILAAATAAACEGELQATEEPPALIPNGTPFEYPAGELWDAQAEGETMLLVHVTERGDVDSVTIDVSSGIAEFDSAAVRGAWQLRFSPARQADMRVPAWTRVPVRFRVDTLATMGTPTGGSDE
jgi:TonB family protein